ncbi:NucA/NucB deoxyribonuclease domain-containing protein [Streptomyces sp. RTd22]
MEGTAQFTIEHEIDLNLRRTKWSEKIAVSKARLTGRADGIRTVLRPTPPPPPAPRPRPPARSRSRSPSAARHRPAASTTRCGSPSEEAHHGDGRGDVTWVVLPTVPGQEYNPTSPSCDEYPFASTHQGGARRSAATSSPTTTDAASKSSPSPNGTRSR